MGVKDTDRKSYIYIFFYCVVWKWYWVRKENEENVWRKRKWIHMLCVRLLPQITIALSVLIFFSLFLLSRCCLLKVIKLPRVRIIYTSFCLLFILLFSYFHILLFCIRVFLTQLRWQIRRENNNKHKLTILKSDPMTIRHGSNTIEGPIVLWFVSKTLYSFSYTQLRLNLTFMLIFIFSQSVDYHPLVWDKIFSDRLHLRMLHRFLLLLSTLLLVFASFVV